MRSAMALATRQCSGHGWIRTGTATALSGSRFRTKALGSLQLSGKLEDKAPVRAT